MTPLVCLHNIHSSNCSVDLPRERPTYVVSCAHSQKCKVFDQLYVDNQFYNLKKFLLFLNILTKLQLEKCFSKHRQRKFPFMGTLLLIHGELKTKAIYKNLQKTHKPIILYFCKLQYVKYRRLIPKCCSNDPVRSKVTNIKQGDLPKQVSTSFCWKIIQTTTLKIKSNC